MNNLRDRGYPQSRIEKPNRSNKRDLVYRVGAEDTALIRQPDYTYSEGRTPNTRVETLAQGLINAYNNKAFGNPNMPLISRTDTDYVDNNNDERAYMYGLALRNRDGNRLAFVNKDTGLGRTGYYAGIDNLPLGDNYYSKSFDTPVGTFGAEYDGDGTASVSYETSPNVYYLQALAKALLSRGTL